MDCFFHPAQTRAGIPGSHLWKTQDHNVSSLWPEASPPSAQGASMLKCFAAGESHTTASSPRFGLWASPCQQPHLTLHNPHHNYLPLNMYSEPMTIYSQFIAILQLLVHTLDVPSRQDTWTSLEELLSTSYCCANIPQDLPATSAFQTPLSLPSRAFRLPLGRVET